MTSNSLILADCSLTVVLSILPNSVNYLHFTAIFSYPTSAFIICSLVAFSGGPLVFKNLDYPISEFLLSHILVFSAKSIVFWFKAPGDT